MPQTAAILLCDLLTVDPNIARFIEVNSAMNDNSTTFPKTRWTLVQKVRSGSQQERASALEDLCKAYWFPLYAFARKGGLSEQEAEDSVQDFMVAIIDSDLFARAEQELGHLRTLLLSHFKNNLKNKWVHETRQKRGGVAPHIPIESKDPEGRYQLEIQSLDLPPEVIFHQQWAHSLIKRALERLRQLFIENGQAERFKALRSFLPLNDSVDDPEMDAAAAAAGMTPGAFRTALHRTRQHYRKCIMEEISQTIGSDDPALIQDEMHALFQVLAH
jgi:DNA-directed RNA polymerase specialized sigma24 family protein